MIIRLTLAPSLTTSTLVLIFKINLDFITAHSSLSLHKWPVLPSYFRYFCPQLQSIQMGILFVTTVK